MHTGTADAAGVAWPTDLERTADAYLRAELGIPLVPPRQTAAPA